jgi:hypothetical protein
VSVWGRCCTAYVMCGYLQAGDTTVSVCIIIYVNLVMRGMCYDLRAMLALYPS